MKTELKTDMHNEFKAMRSELRSDLETTFGGRIDKLEELEPRVTPA